MVLHHIQEGDDQIRVRHSDHAVEILLQVGKDLCSGRLDSSAVCNGVDLRKRYHFTLLQGCLEAGRSLGLYGVHFRVGPQHLHERGDACRQSASAYRHQDDVDEGQVLDDLHGDRALAGGDVGIVERMNKGISVFFGQLVGVVTGLVIDVAVQNDLGSQRFGPVHLDQRRCSGHYDHRLGPELFGRISDALCVVSGGSRDQAAVSLLLAQRADLVVSAANLVGTCPLSVLRFEIDLSSGPLAEIVRVDQRCIQCDFRYGFAGLLEFLKRQFLFWSHVKNPFFSGVLFKYQ